MTLYLFYPTHSKIVQKHEKIYMCVNERTNTF